MKKILFASLLFAMSCILMAQQRSTGEFTVEIWQVSQQNAAVIVGYNGASVHITIPEQINGYPVAGIGDNAFRSRRIESVNFPPTLVFIGNYAFYDNRLTGISLPAKVASIGTGAFDNNYINRNPSASPSATTYTRTFTIEPVHSETVYVERRSPPAPQTVNITVVPGYSPIPSTQQPAGIVTVREYKPNIPAPVSPQSAATPVYPGPTPAQTYRSTPTPQQNYAQNPQPQGQGYNSAPNPQQGYNQQQAAPIIGSRRTTAGLYIVPEDTRDIYTGLAPQDVPPEVEPIRIYEREVYPIWQNRRPQ
jgi:hypothetical protein